MLPHTAYDLGVIRTTTPWAGAHDGILPTVSIQLHTDGIEGRDHVPGPRVITSAKGQGGRRKRGMEKQQKLVCLGFPEMVDLKTIGFCQNDVFNSDHNRVPQF